MFFWISLIVLMVMAIWLLLKFRPRKIYANRCGHRLHLINGKFKVRAFGRTVVYSVGRGDVDYCPVCLAKVVIECVWCQRPIFPQDPICCFSPPNPDPKIPDHAYILSSRPLVFISCTEPDCLEKSRGEINGLWMAPGRVEKINAPAELTA